MQTVSLTGIIKGYRHERRWGIISPARRESHAWVDDESTLLTNIGHSCDTSNDLTLLNEASTCEWNQCGMTRASLWSIRQFIKSVC